MAEKTPRKVVDWTIVEKAYRAGIRPLRDIASEHDITEAAIRKHAKKEGWTRDLTGRIQAKAEEKVRKAEVRKLGSQESKMDPITEKQVVEANAAVLAEVDIAQRGDIKLAMVVSRGQLEELAAISNPKFAQLLEELAVEFDRSTDRQADKRNELYRYIISLAGRVKMSKEIAASHGVYVPLQRRIYKLDDEADKSLAEVDLLLKKINAEAV